MNFLPSPTAGIEPQEAGIRVWRAAVPAEQAGGLSGSRRLSRDLSGRSRGCLLGPLRLRWLGRGLPRRCLPPDACVTDKGRALSSSAPRIDSSMNEMSLRPRSTASSSGVSPSTFCPCRSAPRLIASRAPEMSPRLIASNSASVGSMSLGDRLAGAAVPLDAAPGRAGGGATFGVGAAGLPPPLPI